MRKVVACVLPRHLTASMCSVAVSFFIKLGLGLVDGFPVVVTCLAEHVNSSVEEVTTVSFTVCRRRFVCTATCPLQHLAKLAAL